MKCIWRKRCSCAEGSAVVVRAHCWKGRCGFRVPPVLWKNGVITKSEVCKWPTQPPLIYSKQLFSFLFTTWKWTTLVQQEGRQELCILQTERVKKSWIQSNSTVVFQTSFQTGNWLKSECAAGHEVVWPMIFRRATSDFADFPWECWYRQQDFHRDLLQVFPCASSRCRGEAWNIWASGMI